VAALSKPEHNKTGPNLVHSPAQICQIWARPLLSGPFLDIGGLDSGHRVRL
jgi:hypothetical protein